MSTLFDILDLLSGGDVTKYDLYKSLPESVASIKTLRIEKQNFIKWYTYKQDE